ESLRAVFNFMRDYQPDTIIQLGDLVDFYDISSYSKDPARIGKMQEEVDMARDFWMYMRDTFPKARLAMKAGNHEDRLPKCVRQHYEISPLRDLSIRRQFKLDDSKVEYYNTDQAFMLPGNF